jgi:hypothetical protein
MTEFNFKPGDKIRDPNWERSVFVRIVALGDETFIGVITGECLYRKAACDWERFVEPEPAPRKQFIIETEYRIPRLGDDVVLLHGGTPRLGYVGGGSTIYVGPHWVVTKITEVVPPAVIPPSGAGVSGIRWTAGGVNNGPGATI